MQWLVYFFRLRAKGLRPVYTCDFWCDFGRVQNAPYPTLHNAFPEKHRVDWKESYHILFEDIPLSNFCWLDGILWPRYATKNPCVVGWDRLCIRKIACLNGPSRPVYTCDFSCDFDAILRTKPAPAYPAGFFSRVTLRRNTVKLAGIGKKGGFK